MNIYSFNKYLENAHYLTDSILSMAYVFSIHVE